MHHAKSEYIMLTKWLPSSPNTIPSYTTHFVGVGGLVTNDQQQVLMVQEKTPALKSFWKLPGGRVEPGEEISDGVVREVEEETGIKTKFESILCFRQTIGPFGMADLYFVCKLQPLSSQIKIQEEEIADCKWMPVSFWLIVSIALIQVL